MFKKKDKSRGQTMVELALVLPIMLLVVLGLVEFGRALFIYTVVSNAAREGVRAGLVDPRNTAWVEDRIRARLVLMAPDSVTVIVNYDDGTDGGQFSDPDLIVEGESRIRVDVSTDFAMITPIIRGLFPATTIQYVSARTIVAGARAHKTPGPSSTPPAGLPTDTPGGVTDTPLPTDTPGGPPPPTATPKMLTIVFTSGYPCRGTEQNANKGKIRAMAYVSDAGGNPVSDATVTIDVESGVLTPLGGGYYGGPSGNCWESTDQGYGDRDVTVTANKSGYTGDTDTKNTTANPICNGSCPGGPPPTVPTNTPTPIPPTVPTNTPTPVPPTNTPGPPTNTPVPPTATPIPPSPTPTTEPPTPSPTPQGLNIVFVSNYPCKQNGSNKPIRVKAYVTDNGGNPVSDATVTVSIAGGGSQTMTPISGQPGYYGDGINCWVSASIYTDHQNVSVSAAKASYTPDSDASNTSVNPVCNSCP